MSQISKPAAYGIAAAVAVLLGVAIWFGTANPLGGNARIYSDQIQSRESDPAFQRAVKEEHEMKDKNPEAVKARDNFYADKLPQPERTN